MGSGLTSAIENPYVKPELLLLGIIDEIIIM
jgi:hypothetical protein